MTPDDMRFDSRRSPVLARRGMVATSHPLAAQAGLDMLRRGGNAADAAVATAAALAVVEPCSTGLGGDCFALFYEAATRRVRALNGSGRAPAALSLDRLEPGRALPSAHTVTIPGAAAGWADTASTWGKLPLSTLLEPAIQLAEQGFPVTPVIARQWEMGAPRLKKASPNGGELLLDGRAPRTGEIWVNASLARVLRELAEGGAEAFYGGRAGAAIVAVLQALGGVATADDLREHRTTFEPPISTSYRGLTVWECGPNGQGLAALIALALLEGFDPATFEGRTPEWLHVQIECMRLGFADARAYVCDPAHASVPVEALLDPAYLARRRAGIAPDRAAAECGPGLPAGDTVYLAAVDGEGNACSFINSNYEGFGTGIVPAGCGFSLQNRGAGFSLDPVHPNALGPGKRPYHTIMPGLLTRAGALYACFGVMGGFMQPQGHLQVVSHLADRQLDPQRALDEPRFCILPGGDVMLEDTLPASVADDLAARGHHVQRVGGITRCMLFGRGQVILRHHATGVLTGGSDGRADGAAVGW